MKEEEEKNVIEDAFKKICFCHEWKAKIKASLMICFIGNNFAEEIISVNCFLSKSY